MKHAHIRNTQIKRLRYFTLAALLLMPLASLHAVDVIDLRCEYLDNPLGIDVAKSRLSWTLETRNLKREGKQLIMEVTQ